MTQPPRGFTLLELLIVVAIIAIGTVGVGLALRDSGQSALETEAQALVALLEGARAQSRASGVPVRWRTVPGGFAWDGLDNTGPEPLPTRWQSSATQAHTEAPVLLGPEPLIPAQTIRLWRQDLPQFSLTLSTDGVHPFGVHAGASAP